MKTLDSKTYSYKTTYKKLYLTYYLQKSAIKLSISVIQKKKKMQAVAREISSVSSADDSVLFMQPVNHGQLRNN